jgi:uncharacterized protein YgbK (DUF1537 family)
VSDDLITFYGDDFTGSVDALLQFSRRGLRGRLFVGLPSADELTEAATTCDVIGVAGIARSLPTGLMADELTPVFEAFVALGARVVQYKACSTADSSPTIGSLGRVIELGRMLVAEHAVPVLLAQPDFGRYTVFGHHFAAEGGTVYRLDRQPTMSRHPSTPMRESDLALHLSEQTELPIAHIPFTEYNSSPALDARLATSAAGAVVLDAFSDDQLRLLGEAILALPRPVFALGSGGLSRALAEALTPEQAGSDEPLTNRLAPPGPTLAVSGSRSAQTARQLHAAHDAGWRVFTLPLGDPDAIAGTSERVVSALAAGDSVALSSHHSDAAQVEDALSSIAESASAIVTAATAAGATNRVILCGGDTSSRVTGMLGIRSLSIAANPWGNVVLLRGQAPGSAIDGVELLLKGGQVGADDLFEQVHRLGDSATPPIG